MTDWHSEDFDDERFDHNLLGTKNGLMITKEDGEVGDINFGKVRKISETAIELPVGPSPLKMIVDDALEEAHEVLMGMISQHCQDQKRSKESDYDPEYFDSICLSANEHALDYAIEKGLIKKEQVLR